MESASAPPRAEEPRTTSEKSINVISGVALNEGIRDAANEGQTVRTICSGVIRAAAVNAGRGEFSSNTEGVSASITGDA